MRRKRISVVLVLADGREVAVEVGQVDASAADGIAQDAGQIDTLQSDVIQTDLYNYTPGSCEVFNDQCLGAPTFPCGGGMCPCVPGADPNCRAGEYCCFGWCRAYLFFDGPVPPC